MRKMLWRLLDAALPIWNGLLDYPGITFEEGVYPLRIGHLFDRIAGFSLFERRA
jgi:hypothetical protein